MRQIVPLQVVVEAKEYSGGAVPHDPSPTQVASRVQDILADVTKHDEVIGWRVISVEPVRAASS